MGLITEESPSPVVKNFQAQSGSKLQELDHKIARVRIMKADDDKLFVDDKKLSMDLSEVKLRIKEASDNL